MIKRFTDFVPRLHNGLSPLSRLESGLGTLRTLVQLRNSAEVRNHVSALCSVLNGLGRGAEADAQRRLRAVLIGITCDLESSDQVRTCRERPSPSAAGFTESFLV